MSLSREGSRETGEGIIVSEAMDWCRSPVAIVPYTIWARQREATNLASSVRQADDQSHANASIVLHCFGDEAGTGGGIYSGTHNAECTPKTWSATVHFEDRNAIRHDDEWWMNHKNTWGKLVYVKDTNNGGQPEIPLIHPKMRGLSETDDFMASSKGQGTQVAQATTIPGAPGLVPFGPQQYEQGKAATGALIKGIQGLAPEKGETFGQYLQRPLRNLGLLKDEEKEKERAPAIARSDVVSITGDCRLIPWKDNRCPAGSQRHHVVADRSMNPPGGRLLSYEDGLTLCLQGNAFPRTLLTGHAVAQTGYDAGTGAAAATSSDGMLSLGVAEDIGAIAAAAGARADGRQCSVVSFKAQLRTYHAAHNLPGNTRVRR